MHNWVLFGQGSPCGTFKTGRTRSMLRTLFFILLTFNCLNLSRYWILVLTCTWNAAIKFKGWRRTIGCHIYWIHNFLFLDHGELYPGDYHYMEDNEPSVLEAKIVYLLMPKNVPISRAKRLQWLLDHLNVVITVPSLQKIVSNVINWFNLMRNKFWIHYWR